MSSESGGGVAIHPEYMENYHSLASSYLHNQCKRERMENGHFTFEDDELLREDIRVMAEVMFEHECRIIDMMFSEGENRVVTKEELVHFVKDRINIVLNRLGCDPLFQEDTGTISAWFYNQLNTVKVPDFFAGTQVQYKRNWKRPQLTFKMD